MSGKLSALRSLESRLKEIQAYMTFVSEGKLPINHDIMYQLQDVFNLLPNLNIHELVKAFSGEPRSRARPFFGVVVKFGSDKPLAALGFWVMI